MTTLDLQIAASADDGQESATDTLTNGTTVANDLDVNTEYAGMRWVSTGLPQGSTIDVAYVTVRVTTAGTDEPDILIKGEDVDAPAGFTAGVGNSNISNRWSGAPTTASVAWQSADLGSGTGTDFNSPSLVTIIQELVNRAGFNGDICLLIQGGQGADAARDFSFRLFDHADGAAGAPRLHIEYTAAGGTGRGHHRLLLTGSS